MTKLQAGLLSFAVSVAALAPGATMQARGASGVLTMSSTAYTGMCDASAAIALSATQFVVANDEDNLLRRYTIGSSQPATLLDLGPLLKVSDEVDIEGAARIGDTIYWITSHGRNKDALERPERLNFFATQVSGGAGSPTLTLKGTPHQHLLEALNPVLAAQGFPAAATKAPESQGGLNIEGLAASGTHLLIGFRNPVPKAQALVVELLNPAELIASPKAVAKIGRVQLLDLGGRGIRSFDALPNGKGFVIVAGSFDDTPNFAVFRWAGDATGPTPVPGLTFTDFRPEALFINEPAGAPTPAAALTLSLLSDDGDVVIEGKPCKNKKTPPEKKRFKLATLTLD